MPNQNPDHDIPTDNASDLAREVHPVTFMPTWNPEDSHHVHRTVEQIYTENFRPGVDEPAEDKGSGSGGPAKP